jgi:serine/threonine protein kinase
MQLGYLPALLLAPAPVLTATSLSSLVANRVWNEISAVGRDFVKSLLCVKPTRRLCATEALNHPWLLETAHVEEEIQNHPPPPGALLKQPSLRNVADNYRKNFAEDRKLKKGGSRFNLIDVLPQDPIEEKSEPRAVPSVMAPAASAAGQSPPQHQWTQGQYTNGNGLGNGLSTKAKS